MAAAEDLLDIPNSDVIEEDEDEDDEDGEVLFNQAMLSSQVQHQREANLKKIKEVRKDLRLEERKIKKD